MPPIVKTRKSLGLKRSTYDLSRKNTNGPVQPPFTLPKLADFPAGTPIKSERSRKLYSEFEDNRTYLLHIRNLWLQRLADLQESNRLLQRMKHTSRDELTQVEPLFVLSGKGSESESEDQEEKEETVYIDSQAVEEAPFFSNVPAPPHSQQSLCFDSSKLYYHNELDNTLNDQPSLPEDSTTFSTASSILDPATAYQSNEIAIDNDNKSSMYANLESIYVESDEDEEYEEEDDEQARKALRLMLEQFGDQL